METIELIPIKEIVRNISYYHLANKDILIVLKNDYRGYCDVYLNERKVRNVLVEGRRIEMNFSNEELRKNGNKLKVRFCNFIELQSFDIV